MNLYKNLNNNSLDMLISKVIFTDAQNKTENNVEIFVAKFKHQYSTCQINEDKFFWEINIST